MGDGSDSHQRPHEGSLSGISCSLAYLDKRLETLSEAENSLFPPLEEADAPSETTALVQPSPSQTGTVSYQRTIFLIVRRIMGFAILSLPKYAYDTGPIFMIGMIFLSVGLTWYSSELYLRLGQELNNKYIYQMVNSLWGKTASYGIILLLSFQSLILESGSAIIIKTTLRWVMTSLGFKDSYFVGVSADNLIFFFLQFFCVLPLCCLQDLSILFYPSQLANFSVLLLIAYLIYSYYFDTFYRNPENIINQGGKVLEFEDFDLFKWNPSVEGLSMGIYLMAWSTTVNIYFNEMRDSPKKYREFRMATGIAYAGIIVCDLIILFFGVLAYGPYLTNKFYENFAHAYTDQDDKIQYTPGGFSFTGVLICIMYLLSHPMVAYVGRSYQGALFVGVEGIPSRYLNYTLAFVNILFNYLIAMAIEDISFVVNILGGFIMPFVTLISPVALTLTMYYQKNRSIVTLKTLAMLPLALVGLGSYTWSLFQVLSKMLVLLGLKKVLNSDAVEQY